MGCGENRKVKLNNGVSYAKSALQQVGVNPFATAIYQNIIGNGGNAAGYVIATLPKQDPVFDSFEYDHPTRPWTIVIRPGTEPNEFSVEGYGDSLKQPLVSESVTVALPSNE